MDKIIKPEKPEKNKIMENLGIVLFLVVISVELIFVLSALNQIIEYLKNK